MVRSEGNMSLKNPVTPPGIDPGTVGLVAQRLNNYATPGPLLLLVLTLKHTSQHCMLEKPSPFPEYRWNLSQGKEIHPLF